ncbi:hypothetical protein SEA_LILYPAD_44 [Gordonia phage LilyPad]|nr:hypothetical protein SEA_LILYPAD_44 [Gordonia phage LilyPad]
MFGPPHYNVPAPEPTEAEEIAAEELADQANKLRLELNLPESYLPVLEDLLCTWEPEDIDYEKVEAMAALHGVR